MNIDGNRLNSYWIPIERNENQIPIERNGNRIPIEIFDAFSIVISITIENTSNLYRNLDDLSDSY